MKREMLHKHYNIKALSIHTSFTYPLDHTSHLTACLIKIRLHALEFL